MLVSLENEYKPGTNTYIIDKITKATISDVSDPKLKELVKKHMMHTSCMNCKKGETPVCYVGDKCKRKFPKMQSDRTTSLEDGFPKYNRLTNEDCYVVPYNPYLLLKYDCHINVEVSSGLKVVKYLYKYITKGSTLAEIKTKPTNN